MFNRREIKIHNIEYNDDALEISI